MHEFKAGDPVYILSGRGQNAERVYGTVTDTWSHGRYVDIQFRGSNCSWPFRASAVYHADQETSTEVNRHVLC